MKHTAKLFTTLAALLLAASLASCTTPESPESSDTAATTVTTATAVNTPGVKREGLWQDALYTADTALGSGKTTVTVEVSADGSSVTFTVKTDKPTLGEALLEHDLIAGDMGDYGMYVKKVNGITADYDVDATYWSLSQNGELLMTGVDSTPLTDGAHYELTRTK